MPDIHGVFDAPTQWEIDAMIPRMMAFIFPNRPVYDFEKTAFDKAVTYQIIHEKTLAQATQGQPIPHGAKSFSIGNFSMSFGDSDGSDCVLNRRTICPTSYGLLLEAGLLYRGVEGRMPYVAD